MKTNVPRKLGIVCGLLLLLACGAPPAKAQQQDLKKLATELAAQIHAKKPKHVTHVTVVDFQDLDRKPNKLGTFLAQQLQLNLTEHDSQLEVVDQSQLGELFEQVEKLDEGLLDPATGRKLGKVAGTEVLILGTVMPSSMSVRLDVKALDLETSKMIAKGSASLMRVGLIDRLAKESSGAAADAGAGPGVTHAIIQKPEGKTPRPPTRSVREQGMLFELDGCSLSGDALKCAFTVTSAERDRWLAVSFDSRSWNDTGDEHAPGEIMIANSRSPNTCARKEILEDVPTRLSLTFPDFEGDATIVEQLRLVWKEADDCYNPWRSLNFEKIALSDDNDLSSAPRSGKGQTRGTNGSGKGGGGILRRMGERLMTAAEGAATGILEKETDKALGRDEEEKEDPPQEE